ncbi:hypothetical protein C8N47_10210 [Mangrovibacterium marinum]|uniref:Uncharacterized protein n=1 Tax=Mangrovibacterium marinum TaxID=1639118 RepID=A0A2T5C538_9BACT|nr:hypothetical protein C8N47_10210 [Mangrovibacterium marinum]
MPVALFVAEGIQEGQLACLRVLLFQKTGTESAGQANNEVQRHFNAATLTSLPILMAI